MAKKGSRCWFLTKEGIYENLRGKAISVTDNDLSDLFPYEGYTGTPLHFGDHQIYPPDVSNINSRIYFRQGH